MKFEFRLVGVVMDFISLLSAFKPAESYLARHLLACGSTKPAWLRVGTTLFILMLPTLACVATNQQYLLNNEIRLAVYEYEQERRGSVKDLVIDFRRDEPHIKFEGQNQNGGHTVWLHRIGAREYFDTRPQPASYLYIQEIKYNNNYTTSTVEVYRSDDAGYRKRKLSLTRVETGGWVVSNDVEIETD